MGENAAWENAAWEKCCMENAARKMPQSYDTIPLGNLTVGCGGKFSKECELKPWYSAPKNPNNAAHAQKCSGRNDGRRAILDLKPKGGLFTHAHKIPQESPNAASASSYCCNNYGNHSIVY